MVAAHGRCVGVPPIRWRAPVASIIGHVGPRTRSRSTPSTVEQNHVGADSQRVPGDEVPTVAEVQERYPQQWVVMAVTESDRHGFAAAGRVVACAADGDAAWVAADRYAAMHPDEELSVAYTGPHELPPDVDVVL